MGTTPIPLELLSALGASPDDPSPHGVITDLLLEAGDPRGDFLVMLMQARTSSHDAKLNEKLVEQFTRFRREWMGALATHEDTFMPGSEPPREFRLEHVDRVFGSSSWHRGFLASHTGMLTGSTSAAPEWLTVRQLILQQPGDDAMPLELESDLTRNLHQIHLQTDPWPLNIGPEGYAEMQQSLEGWRTQVQAYLHRLGRAQLLRP